MEFTEVLESVRQQMGLTQARMAERIGMSLATYKDYVYKVRTMHPLVQNQVARELKSPLLALLVLTQFEGNPFAPLFLAVDQHPAQALCVAIREVCEAHEALTIVDIAKSQPKTRLRAIDQLMDLLHLIPVLIMSWCAEIGEDPWDLKKFNTRKIAARGYLRTLGLPNPQREEVGNQRLSQEKGGSSGMRITMSAVPVERVRKGDRFNGNEVTRVEVMETPPGKRRRFQLGLGDGNSVEATEGVCLTVEREVPRREGSRSWRGYERL